MKLTEAGPLAKQLSVGHLDEGDLVLATQRDDQLLIGLLLAVLVEHAHVRLATVERLARLAESAREAIMDEGELQDTFERLLHAHAAAGAAARWNFDFLGRRRRSGGLLFSVRLRWCTSQPLLRTDRFANTEIG